MNSVFRSSRSQIFFKIGVLKNFHWKTPALKSLYNKVSGMPHSWNPPPLPPPLIKGERVGPSKNWVTWGGGGIATFFITWQFSCIHCIWGRKVKFGLLHFYSSVFWVNHARFSSQVFIVLKHCIICTFLIY